MIGFTKLKYAKATQQRNPPSILSAKKYGLPTASRSESEINEGLDTAALHLNDDVNKECEQKCQSRQCHFA